MQKANKKVAALAVASEPEIFWKGENAKEIVQAIKIPKDLGRLEVPKNANMNGPSGKALDDLFLKPLGFTREDAWLCDLLPESRVNPSQKKARNEVYNSIAEKYNLPTANVPVFRESELDNRDRMDEISKELRTSKENNLVNLLRQTVIMAPQ